MSDAGRKSTGYINWLPQDRGAPRRHFRTGSGNASRRLLLSARFMLQRHANQLRHVWRPSVPARTFPSSFLRMRLGPVPQVIQARSKRDWFGGSLSGSAVEYPSPHICRRPQSDDLAGVQHVIGAASPGECLRSTLASICSRGKPLNDRQPLTPSTGLRFRMGHPRSSATHSELQESLGVRRLHQRIHCRGASHCRLVCQHTQAIEYGPIA